LLATLAATKVLEDALSGVERVASSIVFEKAAALMPLVQSAWAIKRDLGPKIRDTAASGYDFMPTPEDWRRSKQAEGAVDDARAEFQAVRRTELQLETIPMGSPSISSH
jgi:hypothetical protein